MDRKQQLDALALSVGEMAESANSVKGTPFALAVTTLFSLDGMRDLGRRLLNAVPAAAKYADVLDALHENVEIYILGCLPEAERQEARNYATRMFNEQRSLHDRIAREGT